MKLFRIILLGVVVGAMGSLVSCKEETPADKINDTTQALEKKAVELKEEVKDKVEETQ